VNEQEHRILVIDDDPLIRKLVSTTLEAKGFSVLLAQDGEEGLNTVSEEHPDLVITDIMMPKVDGFELVRRLRNDPMVSRTPLVILSAKGEEEDLVKGLELGADDYITKPFRPKELVARLNTIFRRNEERVGKIEPPEHGPFTEEGLQQLARCTFETFVVGVGNKSAYEAARAAADNPGARFNPLFLYGGPGLGKTHLMSSMANMAYSRNPKLKIRYLTSEVFSQQILEAYRSREVDQLRTRYTDLDILIIDDIQFLAISQSLQHVAADVLSRMYDSTKQIIISSDRRPEELATLTEEITTGFTIGLVVEVDRPDASLRSRILRSKADQYKWPLDESVVEYLAQNLDADIRTLEGAAKRLVAMKSLSGEQIDMPLVDRIISEVTPDESDLTIIPEHVPSRAESFVSVYQESSSGDTSLPMDEIETKSDYESRFKEFDAFADVERIWGVPEEVAFKAPASVKHAVILIGNSMPLIVDSIEALANRTKGVDSLPEGERWAYMLNASTEFPQWVFVGLNDPDDIHVFTPSFGNAETISVVTILDGKNPAILHARNMISAMPDSYRRHVVIIVNIDRDTLELTGTSLSRSLRSVFRIPEEIPMVLSPGIAPEDCRKWFGEDL